MWLAHWRHSKKNLFLLQGQTEDSSISNSSRSYFLKTWPIVTPEALKPQTLSLCSSLEEQPGPGAPPCPGWPGWGCSKPQNSLERSQGCCQALPLALLSPSQGPCLTAHVPPGHLPPCHALIWEIMSQSLFLRVDFLFH